jgi:hypothetical protein
MTNYYVSSSTGSDQSSSNGTNQNSPFLSIQRAANIAKAGDIVYIMPGEYKNSDPGQNIVTITQSGTVDAPITFKAFDPNDRPVIKVRNYAGIEVAGSHVNLDGLIVQGNRSEFDGMTVEQVDAWQKSQGRFNPITSGSGIIVGSFFRQSYPTHVKITNSIVRDLPGGGISTVRADYITVENNEVYRNAWYSPYNNSGISFYQNSNSDGNNGAKFIVRGNTVYGNQNLIKDYNRFGENNPNSKINDGNGIIVDDGARTQVQSVDNGQAPQNLPAYQGKTIIEYNRVFNNGGRGIEAFNSANVEIRNNVVANNLLTPNITGQDITNNSTNEALAKGAGKGVVIEANSVNDPNVLLAPLPVASAVVNPAPILAAPPVVAVAASLVVPAAVNRVQKLQGTDQADRLILASSNQTYQYSEAIGGNGDDVLTGSNSTNFNNLFGGNGNDILNSGVSIGYNYLMGGKGNDQINLSNTSAVLDIVTYETGDGQDTISGFDNSDKGKNDQIYFKGIANIDIVAKGGNVEFHLGDGITNNAGFGNGELLVKLEGTPMFQKNDVGILLIGNNFDFS